MPSIRVRKDLLVAGVTTGMAALMAWSLRAFGARSAWFAFVVVWLPLVWFALLWRVLRTAAAGMRLPAQVHALRAFERDGRVYELLGVLGGQGPAAPRPWRRSRRTSCGFRRTDPGQPGRPRRVDAAGRGRTRDPAGRDAGGRRQRSRPRLVGRRGLDLALQRPRQRLPGDAAAIQPCPLAGGSAAHASSPDQKDRPAPASR